MAAAEGLTQERKEEFMALQGQLIEQTNKLKQTQMQGRSAAAEKRRAELTVQELQAMPQETKTFLNVGKMYVLRPKTEIEESIVSRIAECDAAIEQSKSKGDYFQKQLEETETSFRDLLSATPGLVKQITEQSA
mmetsp:Transcript_4694/g.16814  ORF Transcript_4694/g.16814 Transcript_4694/m.16814 type:complete len:134 (-) Transcript_4694:1449-1850(-)